MGKTTEVGCEVPNCNFAATMYTVQTIFGQMDLCGNHYNCHVENVRQVNAVHSFKIEKEEFYQEVLKMFMTGKIDDALIIQKFNQSQIQKYRDWAEKNFPAVTVEKTVTLMKDSHNESLKVIISELEKIAADAPEPEYKNLYKILDKFRLMYL